DLEQFRRWYAQAGTPELTITDHYDPETRYYELTVRQHTPASPGQPQKQPFHIPLALGLLGSRGEDLPLQLDGENAPHDERTRVLELHAEEQTFRFVDLPERPIPSLARGFSAPVKLRYDYADADLRFLLAHDSDAFNRWEAGQQLAVRCALELVDAWRRDERPRIPAALPEAFGQVLTDEEADPALRAQVLTLPGESYLAEQMDEVDVERIHQAREHLRRTLADSLRRPLQRIYEACSDTGPYRLDGASIGRRSLRNRCLDYLVALANADGFGRALEQYRRTDNMTDQLAALRALVHGDAPEREEILADFYHTWRHEPLVIDKWLTLQATQPRPDVLDQVRILLAHEAFSLRNPNKVRAVLGAFCQNPLGFHAADGSGYRFIAEQILSLNDINPQIAARLLGAFTRWRRYDPGRQILMRAELKRILARERLSPDVYEIASKSLDS
ncbi:MAG: DUF3458 domain-containing protein, partial [Candidatus Competibacterales bacterium]|nr:DUF3458 domain-containing protein [Candidatus Competibacterales bacterium]